MPRATLLIAVEGGADARRAFGQIASAARTANQAMSADSRRTSQSVYRDNQDTVRSSLTAAAARIAAEKNVSDTRGRLMQQATRSAATEIAMGVTTEENGARRREAIYRRLATSYIDQERRKTAATEQEEGRRGSIIQRAMRRLNQPVFGGRGGATAGGRGRSGGSAMGAVARGGSVLQGAESMLNDVQDARERRAAIENVLDHALYQSSTTRSENSDRRAEILSVADAHNIDFTELAQAASEAQGRFSVLGTRGDSRATRSVRMREFLSGAVEAHSMGVDIQQYSLLAGALGQGENGLHGQALQGTMRSLTGIAQRGGIELGDVINQDLGPLMAAVNRATPGGPAAIQQAVTDQIAALEVLAPAGVSARSGGGALEGITQRLHSDRTQQSILAHIRNRFGANSAQEAGMFTRDAHGHSTLNANLQSALAFGEHMSGVMGNDADALGNILGTETSRTTGHTLAQSLLRPQINALRSLTMRDGSGKTGWQRYHEIAQGATLSDADVEEGRDTFENNASARLLHQKQQSMLALTSNTALNQLADNRAGFAAENPMMNSLLDMLPSTMGSYIRMSYLGLKTGGDVASGTATAGAGQLPAINMANGLPVTLSQQSIAQQAEALAAAMRAQPPTVAPHDVVHATTSAAANANGTSNH